MKKQKVLFQIRPIRPRILKRIHFLGLYLVTFLLGLGLALGLNSVLAATVGSFSDYNIGPNFAQMAVGTNNDPGTGNLRVTGSGRVGSLITDFITAPATELKVVGDLDATGSITSDTEIGCFYYVQNSTNSATNVSQTDTPVYFFQAACAAGDFRVACEGGDAAYGSSSDEVTCNFYSLEDSIAGTAFCFSPDEGCSSSVSSATTSSPNFFLETTSTVTDLQSEVDSLQNTLNTLNTTVNSLSTTVGTLQTNYSTLNTTVNNFVPRY